jgi:arylsulfatase
VDAGKHSIVIDTSIAKPGAPGEVIITIDGSEVGRVALKRTVPGAFTASETLDVGCDLGSTVSTYYFPHRPFGFDGKIGTVKVQLK